MVILGGWVFLLSEVPLQSDARWQELVTVPRVSRSQMDAIFTSYGLNNLLVHLQERLRPLAPDCVGPQ